MYDFSLKSPEEKKTTMKLDKAQLFTQTIVILILHKNSNYKPGLMKIFHPCKEELTE